MLRAVMIPRVAAAALALASVALGPASAAAFCQTTDLPQRSRPGTACEELCNCPVRGLDEDPVCTTSRGERALRIRWSRPCLEWALNEDGSLDVPFEDVRALVARAFDQWTGVDCGGRTPGFEVMEAPPVSCDAPAFDQGGRNANVIAFATGTEWGDAGYDSGALAVTEAWFGTTSGEIFDADLIINEGTEPGVDENGQPVFDEDGNRLRNRSFLFVDCPATGCAFVGDPRTHDLGNVITHELGHFFGLGHTPDDEEATMWACAAPDFVGAGQFRVEVDKRELSADDEAGICAVYAEGALGDACDFAPRGGRADACVPGLTTSAGGGCRCDAGGNPAPTLLAAGLLAIFVRRRRRARGLAGASVLRDVQKRASRG